MGKRETASPEAIVAGVEERAATLQAGFRSRYTREQARLSESEDSEFWVCLTFRSQEHKRAFLKRLGILFLGDTYVDGHKAAMALGIDLPPAAPVTRPRPPAPRWRAFAGQGEVRSDGEQEGLSAAPGPPVGR